MPDRRQLQAFHPFARLNQLLAGATPKNVEERGDTPILLSVGEPQNQPPAFVAEELARAAAGWSRYPPPRGTAAYREACASWLQRRYNLPASMIDPERHILPLPGSREGLFFASVTAAPSTSSDGQKPVVLVPNPFYHVYPGAAASVGAEPVYVTGRPENRFLPDIAALDPDVLARAVLYFYCSPANPHGSAADKTALGAVIQQARRHDFTAAFDECYAEIYTGSPPAGALEAAADLGGSLENLLVFHSLSKRSSAPGLRCGFVVGDEALIAAMDGAFRVGGAGVPLPIMAAGSRLWREEEHVVANRELYRANFEIAERILGNRFGFVKPDGGFFLWLNVGDGVAATERLWREAGIKVLPGAYMCHEDPEFGNPGTPFIRAALVYDAETTEAALNRMVEVL
jgi:aspartate/methionine/tyrosine aminotransferase